MRTTLDLPKDLLEEALFLTKLPSKTEVIKEALRNLIQHKKVQKLKNYKGAVDLDIDLDGLRKRNASLS